MIKTTKSLTRDELKEIGKYARSIGFDVHIMADCRNASFNFIHFVGVPNICVYYDVDPVQSESAYVHIYWSNGSFSLEDTETFIESMSYAQNIARKLLGK